MPKRRSQSKMASASGAFDVEAFAVGQAARNPEAVTVYFDLTNVGVNINNRRWIIVMLNPLTDIRMQDTPHATRRGD